MARWPQDVDEQVMETFQGGRAVPPGYISPEQRAAQVEAQRTFVSVLLMILGTATISAGSAMMWGPGAALFTGGLCAIAVGILIGRN